VSIALELSELSKTFTMHLRGGLRLPVLNGVTFAVQRGECLVISGRSGVGKSSILKMIFGSYRCNRGSILVHDDDEVIDVAAANPRRILALRRRTIGYVSQFLRAVPRVPAIDVVAEPLIVNGVSREVARQQSTALLCRLNLPERLWNLPPATFSGGEQQRVNVARGFLPDYPILLLDEPTASLDATNRVVVVDLIKEKKQQGAAIVAVVHDDDVRSAIADSIIDVAQFSAAA